MSGCQRCLVCGCLAVSDVLCAIGDCVLKQRSQPAAVSIPLFNFVTTVFDLISEHALISGPPPFFLKLKKKIF